jgi:hypothetical protein
MSRNPNMRHFIGLGLVMLLALGCSRWSGSGSTQGTPSSTPPTVTTITEEKKVTTTQPVAASEPTSQPEKPALNVQISPGTVPAQQTSSQSAQPTQQSGTQQPQVSTQTTVTPAQPQR